MIVFIDQTLAEADLAELRSDLAHIEFASGATTAGRSARAVKRNEQAISDPCALAWRDRIAAALLGHPVFQLAARPKRIIGPMLSRYSKGDRYGLHVDEPIMDGSRTDLSFTLFLDDPATYDGGELVIDGPSGEDAVKLDAGRLVLYPSSSLHRVAEVKRGTRHAAVGWVRSHIRDAACRELLFDLETARLTLLERHGPSREHDLLSRCAANLQRIWVED
jgi:PKHD-type hydroxylase